MQIGMIGGYAGGYNGIYANGYANRTGNQEALKPEQNQANSIDPSQPLSKAEELDPDKKVKNGRRSSPEDCETCKNRKYQDESDEANVSFKAASHVSPEAAGGAVRAHEQQHVSNAYKKAAEGEGKVVAANVSIQTAVCPECGTSYVAGGLTRTSIMYKKDATPVGANDGLGQNINYQA